MINAWNNFLSKSISNGSLYHPTFIKVYTDFLLCIQSIWAQIIFGVPLPRRKPARWGTRNKWYYVEKLPRIKHRHQIRHPTLKFTFPFPFSPFPFNDLIVGRVHNLRKGYPIQHWCSIRWCLDEHFLLKSKLCISIDSARPLIPLLNCR